MTLLETGGKLAEFGSAKLKGRQGSELNHEIHGTHENRPETISKDSVYFRFFRGSIYVAGDREAISGRRLRIVFRITSRFDNAEVNHRGTEHTEFRLGDASLRSLCLCV
jgi:hypothetical protein